MALNRLERLAEPRPARPIGPQAAAYLNLLRRTAMDCRSKRRTDLFQACALLHVSRSASREAHAEALMRCLPEALGKPARLHAPGTAEHSFDEIWLIQLGQALTQGDRASATFLLRSRVMSRHRRLVEYLVGRISTCLALP